ncbi:MAG: type I restriction enzyme HsdR N-terminal domain-containing protein [Flavobacteriaceae bacterium]|nr:type I restriction enzyme HsdR N-terminal domain-containing protein [Flavobacteriaceae bacterium]
MRLNFPPCEIKTKEIENKTYLFDIVRKKWMVENPEEIVRIHCVNYLISHIEVPISMIIIESLIKLYNTVKRIDILVKRKDNSNFLLVECKSPSIKLTPRVFEQITRYNLTVKSDYLMVTNGLHHVFYQFDFQEGKHRFLSGLPKYS